MALVQGFFFFFFLQPEKAKTGLLALISAGLSEKATVKRWREKKMGGGRAFEGGGAKRGCRR